MLTLECNEFITVSSWSGRCPISGIEMSEMILRHTSALEFLEYIRGYMRGKKIEVYTKKPGRFSNVDYRIVNKSTRLEI